MTNPHWLRSLAAVAESGSFTRAAMRLGLTQAAISQHLRKLETTYGPLLLRHAQGVEVTPAGQLLLEYWQDLQRAQQRLHARLSDTATDQGEIGLITPGSVGLALYPVLLQLQRQHPGLVMRHRFAPEPEVLAAVRRREYELGVVSQPPDDPHLAASVFAEEVLELVVPARARAECWEDLQHVGFIDHPDGHGMATRLLTRRFPGNPGISSLPVHGFTNQVALILEPVALGLGFTVIPRHARQSFARQQAIRVVECGDPIVDTLWLIHRAQWPLSAPAAWVVHQLRTQRALAGMY